MNRKFTLLVIVCLIGSLALMGCSSGDTGEVSNGSEEQEQAKETFKVGLEAGYPPFNWTQMDDSNGAVAIDGSKEYAGGYDVEIAKLLAEGMGKELVIVKTEWDGLVPALTSGKIDAIIAGMSPTADRKESIDFSDNYYKSDLIMVVKAGSEYENAKSIHDFNGARITGQLNTFHYSVIDQIDGVKKEQAMDNFPAMRVALESGMIDGYVSERPEGVSVEAANSNLKMVEFEDGFETSDDDTAIAVGIKKASELREKINEILNDISEDKFTSIMDKAIENQPSAD